MTRIRNFFSSSFGSALIGGAVVAIFGVIAISAGWVGETNNTTRTITAPMATTAAAQEDGDQGLVSEIYERDGQGVAFITATGVTESASPFDPFGGSQQGTATGSGFVIDKDGLVVTNNHVVEGAGGVSVKLGDDETEYDAEVMGTDPATDLAVLKVDAPADALKPLKLGDSDGAEVGDPVVAIGNPYGLDRTVTTGIVSALQREIQAPNGFTISNVLQTDAAINPGNSGGPLINSDGEVIGVNSQIATGGSGSGNVGIGFAIPSSTVKDVVAQIEDGGEVQHAYMGITGGELTSDIANALNLPVDHGVLIQEVAEGGPADKAGLRGGQTTATIEGARISLGGDIITGIEGDEVESMEDVISKVNESEPGNTIEVTVQRGSSEKTVDVTLADQPDSASSAEGQGEQPQGGDYPFGFGN